MSATRRPIDRNLRRALHVVGWVMLAAWILWWLQSYRDGVLLYGKQTWVSSFQAIGLDFLHNYLGVRFWLNTGNPYTQLFGDPMGIPYNYAPVVLGIFAWCHWVDLVPAVIGWSCAVALMVAAGAWYSNRVRGQLAIPRLPAAFALAAMLFCTGTVFSMERGNCDALVVLMLLIAAMALRKEAWKNDVIVGLAMALATLIKVYPALTIFGLLALRRRRAFVLAVVAGLLISAITPTATLQWLHNIRADAARHQVPLATHVHTLSGCWHYLFDHPGLRPIDRIPPLLGAGLVIVPFIVWCSLAVMRSERRKLLAWPYLLWLTQAASFWSPVSYDYKLLFLPLTMICLWERRSPWLAHVLLIPFLLYWQPMRIEFLGPIVLLLIKLAALFGGAILVHAAAKDHLGVPSISAPQ